MAGLGSTLPFQTRLALSKPVLLLTNEHGLQKMIKVDGSIAIISIKKFPYRPTHDVSLPFGHASYILLSVAYPGIFFRGGGSTNSVEDRGQR